ncbi:MFS transporter [Salinicola avicenniae]|uniref:MFS transporter n=1 Tax=Salinicola avicenniae TaxID=2916836 RepID=UPI002073B01D|nr:MULTISPECIES: MFS transporter [unclassified Salinicola]
MPTPDLAAVLETSPTSEALDATGNGRVGPGFIAAYTFALFGIWMLVMTPATVSLALRVNQVTPDSATSSYSLIAGIGALVAMFANPLFGRLSDITTSRFGMRRPWMLVGALGGGGAAALLAGADSLLGIFAGWALMQLFVNAAIAALIAVIADQVPPQQQGLLSGIAGMTPTAGILAGTYFVKLFPNDPWFIFMAPAIIAVVAVLLFMAVLPDRRLAPGARPDFDLKTLAGSFYIDPRKAPSFSWYLLSMFLIASALAVVQTYLFFFIQNHLGIATERVPGLVFYAVLVMNLIALALSPLSGLISDRIQRRKPVFAMAGAALALGAVLMLLAGGLPLFFLSVAIMGVGYGLFSGLYIAMGTETMVDPTTNARDLGLVNIAYTLPYSLIPLVAPLLLAIGEGQAGSENYGALLITAAIVALVGIPVLKFVRIR